ncbi:zinc metallopeptidase [Fulvivirga kasyanovii]|uniref:Zinc metallopeptidase n=1 Tax=Fulvivirga kasyanovii TaxID=396812 RepID=A0ABW9RT73_9BACT|nr:zinc metallopeptidase [Fulvivirga kasyanovii]MTI27096.1 zinc metallopeptidase [Fulvivirga kasyanovii]
MVLWLIFGVFFILSLIAGGRLKSKFREYQSVPTANGMSGAEVAQKMLRDYGIYDVRITSIEGTLTDHYNPQTKTVNLSQDVYYGAHVAAASVAAHEVGHAVQHATAYAWLGFRSALVPIQNISATILNFIFIGMFFGSFFLGHIFPMQTALLVIVACYAIFALFALVTLPVEFDATKRALAWLNRAGITDYYSHPKAVKALNLAASTYVIAALSSLATLLYYLLMLLGSNDE